MIDLRSILAAGPGNHRGLGEKTGRCVVVHEATRTSGFGAELVSLVQEHCFYHLEAPSSGWRVGHPYPHARSGTTFLAPKGR